MQPQFERTVIIPLCAAHVAQILQSAGLVVAVMSDRTLVILDRFVIVRLRATAAVEHADGIGDRSGGPPCERVSRIGIDDAVEPVDRTPVERFGFGLITQMSVDDPLIAF